MAREESVSRRGMKMKEEEIRKTVRDRYARVAQKGSSCCTPVTTCCGSTEAVLTREISRKMGYTEKELETVPEGANLGLGCGNPLLSHL